MQLKRVRDAIPLEGFRPDLLAESLFGPLREDETLFRRLRVEGGTVTWPNGADICPDVLIWGSAPPPEERESPRSMRIGRTPTPA